MAGTIMVGFDGSPSAQKALDWALRRAETAGNDVVVLYVADTSWDSDAFTAAPMLQGHGEVVLAGAAFHADSKAPHVTVTSRVATGNPVAVLCAEAEAAGAELLVVGSYRKDLYERITTSAVSVRVAAAATVPVAVIPDLPHEHRRGVVVGIDGAESSVAVLEAAVVEARLSGEPLLVLAAWTLPPTAQNDFADTAELARALELRADDVVIGALEKLDAHAPGLRDGVEIATSVVFDSPVSALLEAAKDATALVVGSHGRRGLTRFLLGSVSHDVIVHAPCPVIVRRVTDPR